MDPVWTWSMLGFGILAAQAALFVAILPRLLRAHLRKSWNQPSVATPAMPPATLSGSSPAKPATDLKPNPKCNPKRKRALLFALLLGLLAGSALGLTLRALAEAAATTQSQRASQQSKATDAPHAPDRVAPASPTPPMALPDADRFAELIAEELEALRASGVSEIAIEEHMRARMQDARWLDEARARLAHEDAQHHAERTPHQDPPQDPRQAQTQDQTTPQATPRSAPPASDQITARRNAISTARTSLLIASGAMSLALITITRLRPQSRAANAAPAPLATVLTAATIALIIIHA